MEIERKWMVNGWPEGLPLKEEFAMRQGYISVRPTVRIREEALTGGKTHYVLCFKSGNGLAREEIERDIDPALFNDLETKIIGKSLIPKLRRSYLLPDGAARVAVGGREGLVRAERTAAVSYRAVAVGAREARIDREFLHPAAEQPAEIARIGVEPPRIAPRVDRPLRHYSRFLESIQIVTGPSFTSATCMSAPKRPVATGRPDSSATRAAKRS